MFSKAHREPIPDFDELVADAEKTYRQQKDIFINAFGEKESFTKEEIALAMGQQLNQKESLKVSGWPTEVLTLFQTFNPSPELCTEDWWRVKVTPHYNFPYDPILSSLSITAIRKRVNQLIDGLQVYVTDIQKREQDLGFYTIKKDEPVRSKNVPDIAIIRVSPEEAACAQLAAACIKLVSKRGVSEGQEVIRTSIIAKGNVAQNFVMDRHLQSIMPALVLKTRPVQTTMDIYPKLLRTKQTDATGCGDVYYFYKYRKADPPCSNVAPVPFETLLATIADVPFQKTNNPRVFDQGLWDEGMKIPPAQVIATVLNSIVTPKMTGNADIRGSLPSGVAARVRDRHFFSQTPMLFDPDSKTKVTLISDTAPLEGFAGIFWNPSEADIRKLVLASALVFPIDQPGKCAAMAHAWMREGYEYRVVVSYGSMPCLWIVRQGEHTSGFKSTVYKSSDFYMMACTGLWVPFHNLSNAVLGEPQIVATMFSPNAEVFDVGDLSWFCYRPRMERSGADKYIDVPIADLKPQFKIAPSARTARRVANKALVPVDDDDDRSPTPVVSDDEVLADADPIRERVFRAPPGSPAYTPLGSGGIGFGN